MYKNKVVLVAGFGTIAIPLVKELLRREATVKVVSIEKEDDIRKKYDGEFEYMRLDLTDKNNCLKAVKNKNYVFNLVGIKGSVGLGQTKVASFLIPMLRFQTNLMEASFEMGVERFLFVGSVCSYPQADIHYEENMWNGMPKQNDRIPGIGKRVGELLGEAFQLEYGWDAVRVVRPANVYGPFDDFNPKTAQVIPSLISRTLRGENPLSVWGDGSVIRDFIFSDDVAYWMCEALEKAPPNFPINLGSGEGIYIKNVAEIIVKKTDSKVKINWDITKPSGDPCRLLSLERAEKFLDFNEITPLEEGITHTINWYKSKFPK